MNTEVMNHGDEVICHVQRGGKLFGILAIHSSYRGTSCGGIRIAPDVEEDEVRWLAEGMTLKFGILGLPQGGAKAGVRSDPDAPWEARLEILKTFGKAILPFLKQRADLDVPVFYRHMRQGRSGYFTAMTVFAAAKHAANAIGLPFSGSSAVIEGFGKVGSALARMFQEASVRVVGISTSDGALVDPEGLKVENLIRAAYAEGSRFVTTLAEAERLPREKIWEQASDILCPCARHNAIDAANGPRIRCRMISAGSNHPYDLPMEKALAGRGILCVPDFVSNLGGVLGPTLAFAGWRDDEISEYMNRRMGGYLLPLIEESRKRGIAMTEIAGPEALARHAGLKQSVKYTGTVSRIKSLGLHFHRRGLLPSSLARMLSRRYFEREVFRPHQIQ